MIHLRNGQADPRRHRAIEGTSPKTWCGKKLLGDPASTEDGVETFISYGNRIDVTRDLDRGDCPRCREAFDVAYAAAFPNGPEPIATFKIDDDEDMERLKRAFGHDALVHAFGPDGGGIEEVTNNLRKGE